MRPALALLLLACLAFWPHFDYPEWRGTEARRVQIAAEMWQTGDYIVPRLWGKETFAKPPFYYWVLAVFGSVFGQEPFAMRLPSVLAFWLLALLAFRCLRRWHDATTAWLGAMGVLVAPVVMYDVPFAEIDPLFALLTVWSLLCLSDGVFEKRRAPLVLAGVLGGLAVMTKGPPYLMFFAGPFVMWWRHSRLRGFVWYVPWVFVFYAVYKVVLDQQKPEGDVAGIAIQESLGRLAFWEARAMKGIPAHVLNSLVIIGLPFSPWLVPWARRTRRAKDPQSARANFLIWGAFGACLVLLVSKWRSTRYLLPAVPMLILGLAPLVAASLRSTAAPPEWARRSLLVFGAAAGVFAIALPWLPFPYPGATAVALVALGMIGWLAHSQRVLVRFALGMPLFLAWFGFADRVAYFETASDFAPDPSQVLARELCDRDIRRVGAYVLVSSPILLHVRELCDGLTIVRDGDPDRGVAPTERWLIAQDRGYVKYPERRAMEVRDIPGYREVLRVQMGRKKSVSLREKL